MKNKTRIKVPKKYHDRIREIYHDDDGYWVNLNKGWSYDGCGTHTIHSDTQKQILECIRETELCECDYCNKNKDDFI